MPILFSVCSCADNTADGDSSSLKSSIGGNLSGSSNVKEGSSDVSDPSSDTTTSGDVSTENDPSNPSSSKSSSSKTSSKTSSSKTSSATSSKVTSSKATSSNATSSKVTSSSSTTVRTLPFSKGINVNGMESFSTTNSIHKDSWDKVPDNINIFRSADTYKNIKSQGFDYVRLAVNFWRAYYDNTDKYSTEQFMSAVDDAINNAIANDLYVMLDFHGWFYIGQNKNDLDEFLYCWAQLAERYKNYSDKLSFELLNEPWYTNGKAQTYLSDSQLNTMQADAIKIIRNSGGNNKTRLIVCCTADGNKAWKLSQLSLPKDDNLAVAIHEYSPYNFTHQGFSWAGLSGKTTTLSAAGGLGDANWDFGQIKNFMAKTGIPVILNEFGVNLDKASAADIKTYLSTITKFCKDNNIPWAYWQYYDGYNTEGAMALYRKTSYFSSQKWDQTALDALFLR